MIEEHDSISRCIYSIRSDIKGDLDNLSIRGFNKEKYDQLAARNIYITRSEGVLLANNQGILFVGPPQAGKSTICKRLEDEIGATYFVGGDDYFLERGILLAQAQVTFRMFPVNPTDQNKTLYEEGVPITDIVYVEKGDSDSSSISPVDVVNSQRIYGYLLAALCFEGDDFRDDIPEESTRYVDMLLRQVPPHIRHYELTNARGCLKQTIKLIKEIVIQNSQEVRYA